MPIASCEHVYLNNWMGMRLFANQSSDLNENDLAILTSSLSNVFVEVR